jgi:NAD(P)-dependent dehydrogenase (short-subunit alcohol dehydrogenase family)
MIQEENSGNFRQSSTMNSEIPPSAERPLAIVTGGSRGLGNVVASQLARLGNRVLIVSKDPERARAAAAKIGCDFETVDFEDLDATQIKFQEIASKYGTPKILVLAHGVMSEKMSKTLRTTMQEWRRVMAINLDSTFIAVNILAPAMAEARDGRIIIFSACLGRMSGPGNTGGLAPYRISKAGVNALVRNLAHETVLGSRGLLVDATCPNHSRTDMGGADAPRSAEEGAATAIWLATREFEVGKDQTGLFWEDKAVIPW